MALPSSYSQVTPAMETSPASQSTTPLTGTKRKRNRLTYSCIECRERKVKCDRTYPACLICQKRGRAASCTYDNDPRRARGQLSQIRTYSGPPSGPLPVSDLLESFKETGRATMATEDLRSLNNMSAMLQNGENEILRLKKHINDLEARLASRTTSRALENVSGSTCPTPPIAGLPLPTTNLPVETDRNPLYELEPPQSFSSSFRTQYSGPSSSFAILKQLQELPAFVRKVAAYFPASEARRTDKLKCGCFMPTPLDKPHEKSDLVGLLPDRLTADFLVTLYVDAFETTYRVLHVPSFMGQYKKLWQDEASATSEFLIVLLLVMATVLSMSGACGSSFHGLSSAARERALIMISTAESWLQAQNREKASLTTFQVQALIYIARGTNCVDLRRQWVDSGYLLKSAIAVGLHRGELWCFFKACVRLCRSIIHLFHIWLLQKSDVQEQRKTCFTVMHPRPP